MVVTDFIQEREEKYLIEAKCNYHKMFLNDLTAMPTQFNTANVRMKNQCLAFAITKDAGIDSNQEYVYQRGMSSFEESKP